MIVKWKLYLFLWVGFCLLLLLVLAAAPVTGQAGSNQADELLAGGSSDLYLPFMVRPVSTVVEQVTVTSISLPTTLEGTAGSWCTDSGCAIGPRLYHAPLPDDSTLVGWTDGQGTGHVTHVSGQGVEDWVFAGTAVRGLVAHTDHSFAVLLWDVPDEAIYLSKRNAVGGEVWTTNLNSDIAAAEFWLGDGRLEYGNGSYAAYFTVKGNSGGFDGHYGDQLTYIGDDGVVQLGGWNWGCSHSMAQLVAYHPELDEFAAVCSADCFPDKSIHWVDASHQIYQTDGNCGGLVSAQLGQMALAADSWKLVFNAKDEPCCDSQGVALATLTADQQSSLVWLTSSNGEFERDPVIGRIGVGVGGDGRYLVGWMMSNDNSYWLGVIDDTGNYIMEPENASAAGIAWGNRDDSFRTRADGSISWVQAEANGDEIRLFRFEGTPFLP